MVGPGNLKPGSSDHYDPFIDVSVVLIGLLAEILYEGESPERGSKFGTQFEDGASNLELRS
jgi:hypothetical protein